ncbi:mechanosensitive ion channel family protein [Methanolacinia petrolearia]|uniref:mechanosensitive ion channel family protein n=1 Tax=Methanolacinia petrolearia TaxID=54120 RepID=UPI003BAA359B
MFRDYVASILLIIGSAVMWILGVSDYGAIFFKLSWSLLCLALVFIFYKIITGNLTKKFIKDSKARYTFKKGILIILLIVLAFAIVQIWVENTESLTILYGIIAVGVAIALQDLFRNFVGGIVIAVSGVYRIGDRVEMGGEFGDVMDIGILNTTMMELKGWVDGEQPTGHLSIIPNSIVISGTIHNYTKDHNFIWDEITIPLTYDSDWKSAITEFLELLKKETGDLSSQADKEIDRLGEKYYLPRKVTEPSIYVRLTDNWIELHLRYVADSRTRRITQDKLSRMLMDRISGNDRYEIASENIIVVGNHKVQIIDSK